PADLVAPPMASGSGLDYPALGDWHATSAVDGRTHDSGTPEPDRFKHNAPGQALMVQIAAAGAEPQVLPGRTGSFAWTTLNLHLRSDDDPAAMRLEALPAGSRRRQTLLGIEAAGRTRPEK